MAFDPQYAAMRLEQMIENGNYTLFQERVAGYSRDQLQQIEQFEGISRVMVRLAERATTQSNAQEKSAEDTIYNVAAKLHSHIDPQAFAIILDMLTRDLNDAGDLKAVRKLIEVSTPQALANAAQYEGPARAMVNIAELATMQSDNAENVAEETLATIAKKMVPYTDPQALAIVMDITTRDLGDLGDLAAYRKIIEASSAEKLAQAEQYEGVSRSLVNLAELATIQNNNDVAENAAEAAIRAVAGKVHSVADPQAMAIVFDLMTRELNDAGDLQTFQKLVAVSTAQELAAIEQFDGVSRAMVNLAELMTIQGATAENSAEATMIAVAGKLHGFTDPQAMAIVYDLVTRDIGDIGDMQAFRKLVEVGNNAEFREIEQFDGISRAMINLAEQASYAGGAGENYAEQTIVVVAPKLARFMDQQAMDVALDILDQTRRQDSGDNAAYRALVQNDSPALAKMAAADTFVFNNVAAPAGDETASSSHAAFDDLGDVFEFVSNARKDAADIVADVSDALDDVPPFIHHNDDGFNFG